MRKKLLLEKYKNIAWHFGNKVIYKFSSSIELISIELYHKRNQIVNQIKDIYGGILIWQLMQHKHIKITV